MADGICLISFSNNADHQEIIYSMYLSLKDKYEVYTIGIENPKSLFAPRDANNFYFKSPRRPGIEPRTFKIGLLFKIAKLIKRKKIKYLYFESLHIWNIPLMKLCKKCIRVEVIHDVIPHNMSKTIMMCTKIACKRADHIIIHNEKYKNFLSENYKVSLNKITYFQLWKYFPNEQPVEFSRQFLFFGRIRKYKGLEALNSIISRTPDVKYYVVGEPDKESKKVLDEIKEKPNATVVDREVTDEEAISYFKKTDWIILPYLSATQSGVVLDAFKYSRPVIAFDVGAIGEQVDNDINGFLVKAGDIDSFVDAVNKASSLSKKELETFAENAYKTGYTKYSSQSASTPFINLIQSIRK